ncbi:acyl--CoA ligase [Primorskyibacter sp. S187A]|uniref:acyl--CoA ligase n=1 Tax=Primorskyibacter sp. S187A TaxID=3415130 RepID=UPI003C7E6ED1
MIFKSLLPPVELKNTSVTERLFEGLEARAEKTVMIDGITGQTVTGHALMDRIQRLAGGLTARGMGAGTVTALMASNCIDWVTAFHGAAYAGGTVTPVNPGYSNAELNRQLIDSGATVLITSPECFETAQAGAEGTNVSEIIVMGDAPGGTSLEAVMGEPLQSQAPIDPAETVVAIPYSSGTTGLPKGVCLTHRDLVVNIDQCVAAMPTIDAGDTTIAVLPFFHMFGLTVVANVTLAQQGCLVTLPRFDLPRFLELIEEHRMPLLYVVPPIIVGLAKHPLVDAHDLSCVNTIVSGAAPLGEALAQAVTNRLGCAVLQGWGMTEVTTVASCQFPDTNRPGTVGLVFPNSEVRIVDTETGDDLPTGEPGELLVRGPHVMKGYLNRPDETARTLSADGWLSTGDVASLDTDGYLTLHDRLKELIKVNGFQVAPAEIEAVLLAHPEIADAGVVGRADAEAGERPVAHVALAPGASTNAEAITAFLRDRLASYKLPAEVHFVEAIPKSPSGKILRRLLHQSA